MAHDWEKELARIDKQLASLPDEPAAPAPGGGRAGSPAPGRARAAGVPASTPAAPAAGGRGLLAVGARLLLTLALAVGVLFWPYDARCGIGLAGYLGAVGVVALAGAWSAVWSWRHRAPKFHVVALALVGWGLALGAAEVLPRVGYAKSDPARALWVCE